MPILQPRLTGSSIGYILAALVATGGLVGCEDSGTTPGTNATGGSGNGGGASQPDKPAVETTTDTGKLVQITPNAQESADEARLRAALAELDALKADEVFEKFPTSFAPVPTYDVAALPGLEKIQASSLKLDDAELSQLEAQGFAISAPHAFPSFVYGYASLYLEDLPVYVSADSILNAVHRSYESILETLEQQVLSLELDELLAGMHAKVAAGAGHDLDATGAADADLFLAVARSLLAGELVKPRAGGSLSEVKKLVALAEAGAGTADISLFGVTRTSEDFSQFKPRSHYTDTVALSRYFRAMIWLGRIDLRLLETQPDGSQLFRRRQLQLALFFRELVGTDLRPHFDRIDRTVTAFVGEADYMALPQVDQLMADLGITSIGELGGFTDEQLAQAIIDGNYGAQRISSHIMINGTAEATLPLSRSFALLGQRYVVDSHVFSNVVYDRIGAAASPKRMLPNPLDAAFAVFGNDQAASLLGAELTTYESSGYPAALAGMRILADDHPAEFWNASLYTLWLGALRQLSPSATSGGKDADSLFPIARTEAWGRRLLSTQLASWAELRHDTVLYAKQSYAGGAACDFPDAYVDPYPEFFAALAAYGTRGAALIDALDLGTTTDVTERVKAHFALVAEVSNQLHDMAEHERSGAALTPEMMAFINEAVVVQKFCGGGSFDAGWYKQLFFNPNEGIEWAPTIADVHTQPTDEGGAPVGKVLHVGTDSPRLMVVVSEGCSGPRAYAGLASAYREKITENFERLDDPTWQTQVLGEPEVPWLRDVVPGAPGLPAQDGI